MMKLKVLGTEAAPAGSDIGRAKLVRLVNPTTTAQVVTVTGDTSATFTLLGNSVEYVVKDSEATITAGGGVLAVSVAYQ